MYTDIKLIVYSYLVLDDVLPLLNKKSKISKLFFKLYIKKSLPAYICENTINSIISGNHLNLLKYICRSNKERKYMIKFLLAKGFEVLPYLIKIAILGENKHKLKTIKLLIAYNLKPYDPCIETAVQHGEIQIVRYLWDLGYTSRRVYVNDAIDAGHLSVVKFMCEKGIKPYSHLINYEKLTPKMKKYLQNIQHF
jgi:hypothetical protein